MKHKIHNKFDKLVYYGQRPNRPVDGRFGVVLGILAYYARDRGFDPRTVQTFVCLNMSVCIEA
jgi:hypothetical protein